MATLKNNSIRIELKPTGEKGALEKNTIKEVILRAASCGIDKVKFTGSDILENKDTLKLIRAIGNDPDIKDISLVTDGRTLASKAKTLADAGLSRVTITLDTLKKIRYKDGDLDDVVAGINAATDAGLKPVKINVTLRKGLNDDEIMDFVQLALLHEYEVRFVEMSVEEEKESGYGFVSCESVKKRLPVLRPVYKKGEEHKDNILCGEDIYRYPGSLGKICFISKRSKGFDSLEGGIVLEKDGTLRNRENGNSIDIKSAAADSGDVGKAVEELICTGN